MGRLAILKLTIRIFLFAPLLSGCFTTSIITAVPGALIEAVGYQFTGKEKSFPASMDHTLIAIQRALQKMHMDIDILEIRDHGGYAIAFKGEQLHGTIELRHQTARLTTVYVKAKVKTREASVEDAIVKLVEDKLKTIKQRALFQQTKYYRNLRSKPSITAERIGWFRPGSEVHASKSGASGWLKVTMPSGKIAFIKGMLRKGSHSVR